MRHLHLSLAVVSLLALAASAADTQFVLQPRGTHHADLGVLRDLFASTNGVAWKNWTAWGGGDPCTDRWHGITCDMDHNRYSRVVSLDLSSNNLVGTLPLSLFNLEWLTSLNLYGNTLEGNIPSTIGAMKGLQCVPWPMVACAACWATQPCYPRVHCRSLNLGMNKLSGNIPSTIGLMKNLTSVDFSSNILEGSIPSTIGLLRKLKYACSSSLFLLLLSRWRWRRAVPNSTRGSDVDSAARICELCCVLVCTTGP